MNNNIENMSVNAIRVLAADAVQKANSGHPGLPLGCAPMAYELWAKHMKHNPANPDWFNRDRFILSGGHGSAMLYSLLHLFGYGLSLDDLKKLSDIIEEDFYDAVSIKTCVVKRSTKGAPGPEAMASEIDSCERFIKENAVLKDPLDDFLK